MSHVLLLEPIERLRSGIGLVVILSLRESREFVQIFLKPCRLFRQMDKAIFDRAGHRMHTHDLVHRWDVPLYCVHSVTDQFLN